MPSRTTSFANLLLPGVYKVMFLGLKEQPPKWKEFLRVEKSNRNYEEDLPISGFGSVPQKPEGTATAYDDPIQGSLRRYTHQAYGLGFRASREMNDDDRYNVMKRMPQALLKSVRSRLNTDGFSVLNNGFTTTISTFQSQSLFNTAHTLLRGGTQANRPTTEAELSVASLQSAVERFRNFTDHDGQRIDIEPKVVVVGPNSEWLVKELLESELKPGTANNEINALMHVGLQYLVSPYITDTDSWFLLGAKADHTLQWFWRTQPQTDAQDDFDTGDSKFKVFMRYSVGATDHLGVYGTQGA